MLDAANELFAEHGYEEVSVEDIARSAGVARGLVHHYFGGRKEVYLALLERLPAVREDQLPPSVGRSARARVENAVSRWLDWTEANRIIYLGTIAPGEDLADPELRQVVAGLRGRAVASLHRSPRTSHRIDQSRSKSDVASGADLWKDARMAYDDDDEQPARWDTDDLQRRQSQDRDHRVGAQVTKWSYAIADH